MDAALAQTIADDILAGNFSRAVGSAETWLKELPASTSLSADAERNLADEAHTIARYFLHRAERIARLTPGMERGKAFEAMLDDLTSPNPPTPVRRAALMYCHAQIADSFARDLAGQKSYQLQLKDLMQLAYSLLMIANFVSAREVLGFILANHPTNAAAHYLMAHAANMTGDESAFFEHYREALYLKPEVVSEYMEFLPSGIFTEMMRLVHEEGYAESSTVGVKERIYALLLEINGIYKTRRKLKVDEARQLEGEYQRLRQEHATTRMHKKAFEPRLLQLLAMLIIHAQQMQNFEKFEHYRSEMIAIDNAIWQTFHQNNLADGAKHA